MAVLATKGNPDPGAALGFRTDPNSGYEANFATFRSNDQAIQDRLERDNNTLGGNGVIAGPGTRPILSAGTGLSVDIEAFNALIGFVVAYAGGSVAVNASTLSYIWLKQDGSVSATTSSTNPGTLSNPAIQLGTAVSNTTSVTVTADRFDTVLPPGRGFNYIDTAMGLAADGVTDDTEAFTTLVEDLIPAAGGTVVLTGRVHLTGSVTIQNPNIVLMFNGEGGFDLGNFSVLKHYGSMMAPNSQIIYGGGQFKVPGPVDLIPQWFGAKGDERFISNLTTSTASHSITASADVFFPDDVGKKIALKIGTAGDATGSLLTTITGYLGKREIVLEDLPTATMVGPGLLYAFAYVFTDNATAFTLVADCSQLSRNNTVRLPIGQYGTTGTIYNKGGTMWLGSGSQGSTTTGGTSITHYSDGDLFVWNGLSDQGASYGTGGGLQNVLITKGEYGGPFVGGKCVNLVASVKVGDPPLTYRRPGEMVFENVLAFGQGSGATSGQWDYGFYVDGSAADQYQARGVRTISLRKVRFTAVATDFGNFFFNDAIHVSMFHCQLDSVGGSGIAGMTVQGSLYATDSHGEIVTLTNINATSGDPEATGQTDSLGATVDLSTFTDITAVADNFHISASTIGGSLIVKAINDMTIVGKVSSLGILSTRAKGIADISSSAGSLNVTNNSPETFQVYTGRYSVGRPNFINPAGAAGKSPVRFGHPGNAVSFYYPSAAVSEVQTLTIDATGGTFQLTYDGQTTAAINWSATNSTLVSNIDAALKALSNIGTGDVAVAVGTMTAGVGTITIAFAGTLGATNVPLITVANNSLTGAATLSIAETTPGVPADKSRAAFGFKSGGAQPFLSLHAEHSDTPSAFRNDDSGQKGFVAYYNESTPPEIICAFNGVATRGDDFSSAVNALKMRSDGLVTVGALANNGGTSLKVRTLITGDTTLTGTATIIPLNPISGGFTVTLPAASLNLNRIFDLKNITSSTTAITIATAGGNIDGASTATMNTAYAKLRVFSDGTNWYTI